VRRINAHDVDGLIALMTSDHVFFDSLGDKSVRPAIERGWRQYFAMVPDYWITIDREFSDEDTSVLIGTASGTYVSEGGVVRRGNKWETPAVWVARIEGQKVAEWRIYSDNEPVRAKMRRQNP
jgi:ketosteroid isomerase-like protein